MDLTNLLAPDTHLKVAEPWMWDAEVCVEEEALVARAVLKRKREFRAGRHAAHHLFEQQGVTCSALLKGQQREPAWPQGWVGSISHTKDLCAVIIAPDSSYRSIGLDVEQSSPLPADTIELICSPQERDHIEALKFKFGQDLAYTPLDKVIFSAKESVHKTYFPINYHTLDFLDARIELNPRDGSFTASIISPEPNPNFEIRQLSGRFIADTHYVATMIALAR